MKQLEYFNGEHIVNLYEGIHFQDVRLSEDNTIILKLSNTKTDYIRTNYFKLMEI